MTLRSQVAAGAILLAGIAGMAGCEDAAKKSVARAPVPGSTITAGKQGKHPAVRAPAQQGTKQDLIARVEQKFASGEQNYKAGPLEAARKDFDQAVDWMLESGYDLHRDPN